MEKQGEIVLQIIDRLEEIAGAPCKKKVQKMIYLIEEKEINLGFPYKIHIYGPYSADLDYKICQLKAGHFLNIHPGNKGHILQCVKRAGRNRISGRMAEVIDTLGRKKARELELIATTLYAERYVEHKDKENIVKAVRKIKGEKFSDEKITDAIHLLERMGYFVLA